jgi:FkbM family methyltransferase
MPPAPPSGRIRLLFYVSVIALVLIYSSWSGTSTVELPVSDLSPANSRQAQASAEPVTGKARKSTQALAPIVDKVAEAFQRPRLACVPSRATLGTFKGGVPRHSLAMTASSTTAEGDGRGSCCPGIKDDIDLGLSLFHFLSRILCTTWTTSSEADVRRFRIIQVGANSGDNANDHLVRLLKMNIAEAALLEPVPWLFEALQRTYQGHRQHIQLFNVAMSNQASGNVTFTAPKRGAKGWSNQMGGLSLPPRSLKHVEKKKLHHLFETIQVPSVNVESLLSTLHWDNLPDAVVIDTEGFDAHIVNMFLDAQSSKSRQKIKLIQYEWKHIGADARTKLIGRLTEQGYCVTQVHYDDIAVLESTAGLGQEPANPEQVLGCESTYTL